MGEGIVVIGAGGHAHVVIDALLNEAHGMRVPTVLGVFDDDPALHGERIGGHAVLGPIEAAHSHDCDGMILAIGDNQTRASLFSTLKEAGVPLVNAIHPSAVVASGVRLGDGVVICAGVVVNPASVVGDDVILNTGCSVDHHNRIADHAHVAPGSRLGGSCSIGERTLVGIGSTLLPGVSVGSDAIVGAGAVVIRDVASGQKVAGNPARSIAR